MHWMCGYIVILLCVWIDKKHMMVDMVWSVT